MARKYPGFGYPMLILFGIAVITIGVGTLAEGSGLEKSVATGFIVSGTILFAIGVATRDVVIAIQRNRLQP